jgi:hypothetical protein
MPSPTPAPPPINPPAAVPGSRSLGTTSTTAAAGDDARFPLVFSNIAAMRAYSGPLSSANPEKVFVTKCYKDTSDTGAMSYRWQYDDTATDDGVLHIKNANFSVGRFQPIKPPDGMIDGHACGPALADIGSIARSFDPTGAVAIGTEMVRVTRILRNAGWAGVRLNKNKDGVGKYALSGVEEIGQSTLPFVPFSLVTTDGAEFCSNSPPAPSGMIVRMVGETSILPPGYGPRSWTQTVVGGETVFAGVSDITGLHEGDWMLCRISKNNTDNDGSCQCYFFGMIKTVTPGAGITGTVETWQCVPEPAPTVFRYPNVTRLVNQHDMIKITGFQDNTTISGFNMNRCQFNLNGYRSLTIDCVWTDAAYSCINGLIGNGLEIPNFIVHQAHGYLPLGQSELIILAQQYGTHISNLQIYDLSPRAGVVVKVLTTEACCRGTRIDYADITYNQSTGGGASDFCGQTEFATDLISVGMLVIRGSGTGLIIGSQARFDVIDYKGTPGLGGTSGASLFFDPGVARTVIWDGQLYSRQRDGDYSFAVPPSQTTTISLPNHGLTSDFRINIKSLTGVTSMFISGDGFATSSNVLSLVTAGQWVNIYNANYPLWTCPNNAGFNSLQLQIVTNGTCPADNWAAVRHSVFEINLSAAITSVPDTSVPRALVSVAPPATSSSFIGQECLDSTNLVWYKSVTTGAGASDWKPAGAGDSIPHALTNADATIAVGGGSSYALAAGTLTGLHTLTLGNTGATDKQAIEVRVYSQGSNYLINDSAATLLLSVASGTKVLATFVWNVGTGKFQLSKWNFFT